MLIEMVNQKNTTELKEEMIEEIKEELVLYFRKGMINPLAAFDFPEFQFNDLTNLLKIHFLLTKEVEEYILNLEQNIRMIKNSTKLEKNLHHGEVRGRIDWNKTMEYRANTFYGDHTKFISDNVDKLYSTKENIILKKTVSLLYHIIHHELKMDQFYERDWYKNGEKYSHILSYLYKSNVYIKKIAIDQVKITNKMIQDVLKSRNKLYRDSAQILKLYRDIMAMEEKQMEDLFAATFIELKNINEVFEFYSIFKYMRGKFNPSYVKYNMIGINEKCLAKIDDGEYRYKIYHNRTAKEYLNFAYTIDEVNSSESLFVNRKVESFEEKAVIYEQLAGKKMNENYWSGRPDLIIIQLDQEDNLESIELGEVKYTDDTNYMYQGLGELLDYIYLVRDQKENYLESDLIRGLLFIDNINLNQYKFDNIQIINRKHLEFFS